MLAPASDLQPPPTPLATPPPPRPSLCRHVLLRICQGADQRRFDGSSRSPNSRRSVASSVRIYFELVAKGPPVPVARWAPWPPAGKQRDDGTEEKSTRESCDSFAPFRNSSMPARVLPSRLPQSIFPFLFRQNNLIDHSFIQKWKQNKTTRLHSPIDQFPNC